MIPVHTIRGDCGSCSQQQLNGQGNMTKHTQTGKLDEKADAVKHLTRSRGKDAPEDSTFNIKVIDVIKEFLKLRAAADCPCCSHCHGDAIVLPRCFDGEMQTERENPSASSLRAPSEVRPHHEFLPPGCLVAACGKQADEDNVLLTAFASDHLDTQDAVPTCNASNTQPIQPGVKAPAARDDPSGCALFQGAPGGDSEQATLRETSVGPS